MATDAFDESKPEMDRPRYAPSGEFSIPMFLMVAPLLLAMAIGLACALGGMRFTPFSLIIYLPLIAGTILGYSGGWLLQVAHVRSPAMGWGAGILLGSIMYLGQFQALAAFHVGWAIVPRLDVLPAIIAADVNGWVIGGPGQQANLNPLPILNWVIFCIELGLACVMAGAFMSAACARVYCERCQKWASELKVNLAPGVAPMIVQQVLAGRLAELAIVYAIPDASVQQGCSILSLESCLHEGDGSDALAYLTASTVAPNANGVKTDVVAHVTITTEEMALLAQRVAGLVK